MALSMTLCSSTTSSLKDPLACLLSDTQSAEGHLGHVKDPEDTIFQTVPRLPTIEYLRSLVTVPTQTASLVALPSFFRFLTKRARESGGRLILSSEHEQVQLNLNVLAHEKPPQDDLVELGISPPGQEPERE